MSWTSEKWRWARRWRSPADALEGQTFTGVVDTISISGTTVGGATSYPVTIILEDYGDLRPGMNVSARIIGEEIPDACAFLWMRWGVGMWSPCPAPAP